MNYSTASRAKRIVATGIVSGLAVALLAACGSSTDNSGGSAAPTQSATTEAPIVGGDPGTWAPVEVTTEDNGKTFDMVPNQAANFVNFPPAANGYYVTSSDEAVVAGVNAPDETTTPGFTAVAPGTATVTLWDGDPNATDEAKKGQPIAEVTVEVSEEAESDATMDSETSE